MRNFQFIGNAETLPLFHAVQRQPELWNANRMRTTHKASPHTQVDDILLRFIDLNGYGESGEYGSEEEKKLTKAALDQHESINYSAFSKLPQARKIIFDLMRTVEGERLGRVIITRLPPGKIISPHIDSGDHAAYFDRYHCILQNENGSLFRAGNETICMGAGQVWWFDNSIEHEVVNNSSEDRITMIVDIRTTR